MNDDNNQVLEFVPSTEARCSFCGTPESVAKRMFSNGMHGTPEARYICTTCVIKAKKDMDAA